MAAYSTHQVLFLLEIPMTWIFHWEFGDELIGAVLAGYTQDPTV